MRRVLHLSDLHFGRVKPELEGPLLDAARAAAPDLTVISGDLTQRARDSQFRAARAFIDRLPGPVLAVPGNHDIPLDNPVLRLANPWGGWKRWISAEREPVWQDERLCVVGVNTVSRREWQRGRIKASDLRRVEKIFAQSQAPFRLVVAHHPLEQRPEDAKSPMRGAVQAVHDLSACGADVVFAGHLHAWRAAPFAAGGALQVQAGTSLSRRVRGEDNDFNLLTLHADQIEIERHAALPGETAFRPVSRHRFRKEARSWTAQ